MPFSMPAPADAIRGGTFNFFIDAYPLTFRLMGPNSNDAFAGWNRAFTWDFPLVGRHPVTDNYIPIMATQWSVQDDQRTIFLRLDPDARFSDGTSNEMDPQGYLDMSRKWVGEGVQVIGGCCGMGLDYIEPLKEGLPAKLAEARAAK